LKSYKSIPAPFPVRHFVHPSPIRPCSTYPGIGYGGVFLPTREQRESRSRQDAAFKAGRHCGRHSEARVSTNLRCAIVHRGISFLDSGFAPAGRRGMTANSSPTSQHPSWHCFLHFFCGGSVGEASDVGERLRGCLPWQPASLHRKMLRRNQVAAGLAFFTRCPLWAGRCPVTGRRLTGAPARSSSDGRKNTRQPGESWD
jgi:hypothetical protein